VFGSAELEPWANSHQSSNANKPRQELGGGKDAELGLLNKK
jgi:hypothetical protein